MGMRLAHEQVPAHGVPFAAVVARHHARRDAGGAHQRRAGELASPSFARMSRRSTSRSTGSIWVPRNPVRASTMTPLSRRRRAAVSGPRTLRSTRCPGSHGSVWSRLRSWSRWSRSRSPSPMTRATRRIGRPGLRAYPYVRDETFYPAPTFIRVNGAIRLQSIRRSFCRAPGATRGQPGCLQ